MKTDSVHSNTRLHRGLCVAVIDNLRAIFQDERYADKVIESCLKANPSWGSRDRRFIAETTYDMVRWHRLLIEISGNSDDWQLLGIHLRRVGYELPEWVEFSEIPTVQQIHQNNDLVTQKRAIRESVPDWLDELGAKEVGEGWEQELAALNDQAPVVIRANTLKTSVNQLMKALIAKGYDCGSLSGFQDAIVMKDRRNLFMLDEFKQGWFEMQDASSQLVAPYMKLSPGMRVIDACAGAGGKSLHIAALMGNKGRIISMDTEAWKLDELKKRARRAGVGIIEPRVIESTKTVKRLAASADRVLLDVPCSGLGVIRRNPDAKWKLSHAFIDRVRQVQASILQTYAQMVKPGGILVYSTCSILPSENREQVTRFLGANPTYKLIEDRVVWPSEGFDGFYMAAMERQP